MRILPRILTQICGVVIISLVLPPTAALVSPSRTFTRLAPTLPMGFSPITLQRRERRTIGRNKQNPLVVHSSTSLNPTNRETHDDYADSPQEQNVFSAGFSLVKAIVGSGVLALPYGVAVMGNAPKAAIPASLFLFVLGGSSAYSFYLIGRLCHFSGAKSIGELWDIEIGERTSWLVSSSILTFTLGAALSYSIVLGDTFGSLAKSAGITGFLASRHASILAITAGALYPLCSLSSLAALAPASILGVIGILITCLFMGSRCLLPSSPYALPNGAFLETLSPQLVPLFGSEMSLFSPSSLILLAMSCVAYLAHYSAPDFYHSLPKNERVLKNFRNLTILGFGVVSLINIAIVTFGFLTFGGNCSSIILNNYSTSDLGAIFCRFLMGFSVIGGFPFLISPARSAYFDLLGPAKKLKMKTDKKFKKEIKRRVTQGLVALVTGLGLLQKDAGFVVSFNGALMGSAIVFIFPSVLYLKATKRRLQEKAITMTKKVRLECFVSRFFVVFGVVSGLLAASVVVRSY